MRSSPIAAAGARPARRSAEKIVARGREPLAGKLFDTMPATRPSGFMGRASERDRARRTADERARRPERRPRHPRRGGHRKDGALASTPLVRPPDSASRRSRASRPRWSCRSPGPSALRADARPDRRASAAAARRSECRVGPRVRARPGAVPGRPRRAQPGLRRGRGAAAALSRGGRAVARYGL